MSLHGFFGHVLVVKNHGKRATIRNLFSCLDIFLKNKKYLILSQEFWRFKLYFFKKVHFKNFYYILYFPQSIIQSGFDIVCTTYIYTIMNPNLPSEFLEIHPSHTYQTLHIALYLALDCTKKLMNFSDQY